MVTRLHTMSGCLGLILLLVLLETFSRDIKTFVCFVSSIRYNKYCLNFAIPETWLSRITFFGDSSRASKVTSLFLAFVMSVRRVPFSI